MNKQTSSYRALLNNPAFMPVFALQFLGAFNDNLFKNALVMLINFKLSESLEQTGLLITLAAGLFILPFFLFSSVAGQLADLYPKHFLVQKTKLAEVLIMLLGAMALMSENLVMLFITLFLMGTQSAFFGPLKYSILPEIVSEDSLIKSNSLFSGSTFIAILLGTIFGGIGVLMEGGLEIMAGAIIGIALLGYLLSLMMVPCSSSREFFKINWNPLSSTWKIVQQSTQYSTAFFAVLAISWFWFIGAVMLSQIPALVKYNLQSDDSVVVLFLTVFSVGIALGAALVGKVSVYAASVKWHWLWLFFMSGALVLSVWSIQATDFSYWLEFHNVPHGTLLTLQQFLSLFPANLSLLFLGFLAVIGGAYIVPLYTLLQTHTEHRARARMVAVNNIMNSLLMVLSAVLLMIGFSISLSLLDMLMILAVLNLLIIVWLYKQRFIADRNL